eukprot:111938_1
MALQNIANPELQSLSIICKCEESKSGVDAIYICNNAQCQGQYYCGDCGPFFHRKKDHTFDIQSSYIETLSTLVIDKVKNGDITKFDYGKQQMIQLIGQENYDRIAPWIEKGANFIGSNTATACTVAVELSSYFTKIAQMNNAKLAVKQSKKLLNGTSKVIKGNWWYSDAANPKYAKAAKKLATAKKGLKAAKKAVDTSSAYGNLMKSGAITCVVVSTIEMGIHAIRYYNGDISGKEWCRLVGKTWTKNIAAGIGATGGACIGVAVGTATCPVLGTGVGFVCGLLFGFLMGYGAETVYNEYFPPEKVAHQQAVDAALEYFHFKKKDIKNGQKFNTNMLKQRFRTYALETHPDRPGGSVQDWLELSSHYGILVGLLDEIVSGKNNKSVNQILAIKDK